jgi:hypothetical protein
MAHGKGHKKGCKCGFCTKSASFAGKGFGKRKRGRKRGK